jgi:RNA polymerase sigma factor (sigma-70 family)
VRHPKGVTTRLGPAEGLTAETSIDELLDSYAGRALALARRIVVDDQLAEDVVQEAFLAFWRRPGAFDAGRGSFGSWFLALVHHKAVDAVRREMTHRRRVDAATESRNAEPASDIAELVAARIGDARVRKALEALPAVQREALVLAYWGGYTQREIALRTGAPLGTVKTRMMVGMRRLADGLTVVVPGLVVLPRVAPAATA